MLFGAGSQPVTSAADVALTAAALFRVVPFTVVNEPPKYTVDPDTTNADTVLFGAGFHAASRLPSALI